VKGKGDEVFCLLPSAFFLLPFSAFCLSWKSFSDLCQQPLMLDMVEIFHDVGIEYPVIAPALPRGDLLHSHPVRSPRTIGKATGLKLWLKQGIQDIEQGLLQDAVAHRWHPQLSPAGIIGFGDKALTQGQRTIATPQDLVAQMGKMAIAMLGKLGDRLAIDPSAALLCRDFPPCLPQIFETQKVGDRINHRRSLTTLGYI
jgi:hypothetical protein